MKAIALVALLALASGALGSRATLAQPTPGPFETLPSPPPPSPSALPSPSATPIPRPKKSLTPDQILSRAEATLRANPDPPYITYKMHEIFVHHGKPHDYNYQVWYRSDGKGLMQNVSLDSHGRNETIFGYPFPVAPDINVLLYATPPPRSTPPPPIGSPVPESSAAPLLGFEKVSGDRYYAVSYAGLESYENRPVYHLTLRAVKDQARHPLTDLWVDTQTFEVWRNRGDFSGSSGPLKGHAIVDAEFAPIGNYWMVKQATADGEGRFGFISDSGHYEYYFSDFGFPNTLPDWYFDQADFARHRS